MSDGRAKAWTSVPCPAIKKISVVVRLPITNPLIRKLGGFTDLSGTEVAALCNATGRAREFRARHDIIREGDKPGPVFVMLEGWAFRYKILADGNRQIMAFLMPGDCSNLNIGMLDEMDHSVQTACRARVAAIPRAEITALVADHPGIARSRSEAGEMDRRANDQVRRRGAGRRRSGGSGKGHRAAADDHQCGGGGGPRCRSLMARAH